MPQTRPDLQGRPVALFVFSNLREQKGGLTRAWLRRLAVFHEAGWDTHIATIHLQPEIDQTLAAWRARGWLPDRTRVHHYQRRDKRFRPAWTRPTDDTYSRDDRVADWLDWLVGRLPGVVVFADSPVTYAPVAKMRNPHVAKVMTVHLAHRGPSGGQPQAAPRQRERSIYQGPAGTPKLAGRFLPFAGAADAVVTLTHRQAEHLRQDVPGLAVHVIPNILDPIDLPDPPVRDPLLVVQLGRLDPFKRIDHAIRAVARARAELPDLHLAVYGRGPDLDRLARLRDELGLHDAVSFPGFTEEPVRVLAGAAASLMTSRREGFGLAVAESLAVGTPVVAYDIDYGPAELVSDGVNGRLVANGSVAALATALVETLSDAGRWQAMSEAGPASVSRLAADRVAPLWHDLATGVAAGVTVAPSEFLVEDLRVRASGLEVSGVARWRGVHQPALVAVPGCDPVTLQVTRPSGDEARPADDPGPALPDGAVNRGSVVRDAVAVVPWPDVARWPVGSRLVAWDSAGAEVPTRAPGIPRTVAPLESGAVLLSVDSQLGVVRREPGADESLELAAQSGRPVITVGHDRTVVAELPLLSAHLVGATADPATVMVQPVAAGVDLAAGTVLGVVARAAEGTHVVGSMRLTGPHRWRRDGSVPAPAELVWDHDALGELPRDGGRAVRLHVTLGSPRHSAGPLEFSADRPMALVAGQRWLLAPGQDGHVLLVPGWGLRSRGAWLKGRLRARRRPTTRRPPDPAAPRHR